MHTYLILGANSDISQSFLHKLGQSKENTKIIAVSYHKFPIEKFVQYDYLDITFYQCDLSDLKSMDHLIKQIKHLNTPIDRIIHLAASKFQYVKLKDLDIEQMQKDFTIQILSITKICRAFLPGMIRLKDGKILLMLSSVTYDLPPKMLTPYVTLKYALCGFMKSLAAECSGKNIVVCGLSPDMVQTKFLSEIDPRIIEMSSLASPTGKILTPEEVSNKIYEILSSEDLSLNGKNILLK
jgi:3-oxoacyl-[acyl-carrier protein] reductase